MGTQSAVSLKGINGKWTMGFGVIRRPAGGSGPKSRALAPPARLLLCYTGMVSAGLKERGWVGVGEDDAHRPGLRLRLAGWARSESDLTCLLVRRWSSTPQEVPGRGVDHKKEMSNTCSAECPRS